MKNKIGNNPVRMKRRWKTGLRQKWRPKSD